MGERAPRDCWIKPVPVLPVPSEAEGSLPRGRCPPAVLSPVLVRTDWCRTVQALLCPHRARLRWLEPEAVLKPAETGCDAFRSWTRFNALLI
jgi:hypothetical protein